MNFIRKFIYFLINIKIKIFGDKKLAQTAHFMLDQGTDFLASIQLKNRENLPYNLTGHTLRSQLRKTYSTESYIEFSTTHTNADGIIFLALNHIQTDTLEPGKYAFDVELTTPDNIVVRILEGIVTVTPSITRG